MSETSVTSGSLIAASKVNGTSVYDRRGEKLGSVYDVMLDKVSGTAQYAILSFGSFLGMGGSYHPLPWKSLTYDRNQGGYVVDVDKSRLEKAPSYTEEEPSRWGDPAYGSEIDRYYLR
jgi:sporulation protein YlmC with PRC-barrel domain